MVADIARLGLIDEAAIELDRAALQLAALDHPDVNLSSHYALIDQATERVRGRSKTALTAAAAAASIAQVLAVECGFEGDRETYDDPANANMIRVIERRRGLPVALSILYVAVARRVGWAAHVLNTPGHVLVAIGEPSFVIIDPFNRGAEVTPADLSRLMQLSLTGDGAVRHPPPAMMPNRAVLVRLLLNEATRAEQKAQPKRALALYERMTTVAPAFSTGWRERARLERALGYASHARESLVALLETTREVQMRSEVLAAIEEMNYPPPRDHRG